VKKTQIERLLPQVFQQTIEEGNPLAAILELMETIHAPSESALHRLDQTFDPYCTPDGFVSSLASWVDLEVLLDFPRRGDPSSASLSTGTGRLRELTVAAVALSKWRGTRKGLLLFLETATGASGFEIEEGVGADGKMKLFHFRIRAPAEVLKHRTLIERIIELEKPAHVTCELEFRSQPRA
jgi:phage tail-like protein